MNDELTLHKRFKRRLLNVFLLTVKKATDPFFAGSSAELAFFLMLSLTPMLIILAQMLGVFSLTMGLVVDLLEEYVSEQVASAVGNFMDTSKSVSLSFGLIVLALWAASKAQFSLSRITNYAFYGVAGSKGFLRERLRAILMIIIILVTMLLALLFLVNGKGIVQLITTYLNDYLSLSVEFDNVWYIVRWPIAFAIYMVMVISIYFVLPSKRIALRKVLPGSIFSTVSMLVATWLFSVYMSRYSGINIYGSLTAIVALLLWFYLLSFVMILGVQINSVWEESGQYSEALPEG